jgi:hypothetical protein
MEKNLLKWGYASDLHAWRNPMRLDRCDPAARFFVPLGNWLKAMDFHNESG